MCIRDSARAVSAGLNDVILEFGKLYPLPLESDETWAIGATGQRAPVPIFVESAGEESGDFAHIWVNAVSYTHLTLPTSDLV